MPRKRIPPSHKTPPKEAQSDIDGRPSVENDSAEDRLLAALIRHHGPRGRPDVYTPLVSIQPEGFGRIRATLLLLGQD